MFMYTMGYRRNVIDIIDNLENRSPTIYSNHKDNHLFSPPVCPLTTNDTNHVCVTNDTTDGNKAL